MAGNRGYAPSLRAVVVVLVAGVLTGFGSPALAQSAGSLAGNNAWIVAELASTAAGNAGGVGAVGNVPYFGNAPLSSGTGDFNPPNLYNGNKTVPGDKGGNTSADRTARRAGVIGLLANGALLALPWAWGKVSGEPHNPGYADPPATGGTTHTQAGAVYCTTGFLRLSFSASGPAGCSTSVFQDYYGINNTGAPQTFSFARFDTTAAGARTFCNGNLTLQPGTAISVGNIGSLGGMSFSLGANTCPANLAAAAGHPGVYRGTAPAPVASGPAGTTPVTTVTTSRCSDGSSSSSTITYKGADTTLPPINVPACPAGTTRNRVEQKSTTADGRTVASPLGDVAYERSPVPAGYPECVGKTCQVKLDRILPENGISISCNATGECARWQEQPRVRVGVVTLPNGSTAQESAPTWPDGTFARCMYGTYTVPVAECSNVATEPAPTGAAVGAPAPSGNGCVMDMSWNPVSWVLEPVKCALTWAFVPNPSTTARLSRAGESVTSKVPFSYIGDLAGWIGGLAPSGGPACLDLGANVSEFGRVRMLDTCTPGSVEGLVMSKRAWLEVAVYVAFAAPLAWWAWKVYAPGTKSHA